MSVHEMIEKFSAVKYIEVEGSDEKGIELESYCDAVESLSKVFGTLGKGFGFVQKDVDQKIGILRGMEGHVHPSVFGVDAPDEPFTTLQEMVRLEIKHGYINAPKKPATGSRTLLRSRWAVEMFLGFITNMVNDPEDALRTNCSVSAGVGIDVYRLLGSSKAYEATLSKHHPWVMRKAVGVAFLALPHRENFLKSIDFPEDEDTKEIPTMRKLIEIAQPLLDILLDFYKENELEDLP